MPAETREKQNRVGKEARDLEKGLVLATTAHAHSGITWDRHRIGLVRIKKEEGSVSFLFSRRLTIHD